MKFKFLGVIFLVVVIAAIVSVVYYWQASQSVVLNVPKHNATGGTTDYKNEKYQFTVTYDKKYQLDTMAGQENYFKNGITQFAINIPTTNYPKTNLAKATITFAAKENSTKADCQTYVTSANKTQKMSKSVIIPSGTWYTVDFSGAAAGTKYDTKIYRILRNETCFEANLTIGVSNIGNYEPGTVSEVTEADVWNDLSAILISLKFN